MRHVNQSIIPGFRVSIIGFLLCVLSAAATVTAVGVRHGIATRDWTAFITGAGETGTIVLTPEDTFLNVTDTNYSTNPILATYTWPDYQVANTILMKFNLSALPAGARVEKATLRLALVQSDTVPETYTVTAHKLLAKKPDITRATGYTADGVNAWTPNTCCNDGVPMAQADLSPAYDTEAIDATAELKAWDLTTMVQEWLLDPTTNLGVVLNSDASKPRDRYRFFASMEHADATLHPYLEVIVTAPDVTPPSVTITAPVAGTSLLNTVGVVADATDNVGVADVQFQLNGMAIGSKLTAFPYALNWDTTAVSDGSYALTALARDVAGNTASSAPVSVTVDNGVLILAPKATYLNLDAVNHSKEAILATYTWPDYKPANAIVLKFDLAAVPRGAVVEEAKLFLALIQSDTTATSNYTVKAHKLLGKNPDIAQATGYTADGVDAWTPNACCAKGVPLAQADIATAYASQIVDKTPGFKTWAITQMVQDWLADPSSNFGMLLNADVSKPRDRYRFFASTEHADASLRPFLRVKYSAPSPDVTPPTVSMTTPVSDAYVSGVVQAAASASDDVQVAGVQFELNSAPLGVELTAEPYALNWDTTAVSDGEYTLTAKARDAAGNVATSNGVRVRKDRTPPSVSMTAPAAGATIAGAFTLSANAIDSLGVAGVQFRLDGANLGAEDTSAPFTISWNSTIATNGSHALTAVARDAAGNVANSAAVTVTVANGPTITGFTPTSGVVGSSVAISGTNFTGATAVRFNGTSASFTVSSATAIQATVPASATTGPISVTTSGDTATSGSSFTVSTPGSGASIASRYPGDVGIEADPSVVFVERFDESSLTNLFSRWTDILNGTSMSFATDAPAGSPVGKSLNIPWSSANSGGHLYRQLSPGVDDTLYVRYYVKYPTNTDYSHHGIWLGGSNPPLGWPNPQAGVKPTGSDRFMAAAEQNTLTSRFDHYDYWMGMRQSADGNYWGNLLLNNPNVQAKAGQWMCVEHMVKLNNPTSASNGEHAIWLDGVKVSHLGQGFPNGTWSGGIFTQDPSGSPFPGFQWRNTTALNLNWMWLQVYATSGSGSFKYAHVVAAKSYIGCLTSGPSSDTTAPTVSITAPTAGATISGTISVSATASDNIGVAGVQFKMDGNSLGAEDTTAPYSISLNTTTILNGSHTLTAIARDAAGNTATSSTVMVSISNLVSGTWPNAPGGFTTFNDQPWNLLTGNAWNYLRRTSSKDASIVLDSAAPFSPLNELRMVFTPDMTQDTEPSVHWLGLPGIKEVFTGWWMKLSPNWECSPAGCGKVTFLFTNGAGQVYTGVYHSATADGPPYRIAANTEWAPYGQRIWYPNVTTTPVSPGEWHRIEFYYRWETIPGVSGDGIIRFWVDGTLNGNYTNVQYPASSFVEFQYAPTLQNPPSAEQHMYIDHTYVSRP